MKKYDSYKDSGIDWIGKIPSHWGVKKTKVIGKTLAGGTPSTDDPDFWNGDIPWLQSGKVQNNIIVPEDVDKYITELGLSKSATKMIAANAVLVALTGATCGNVGLLTFNSTANQSVVGIEFKEGYIPKFNYYQFLSIREQILISKSGGAQGGVSEEVIKNLITVQPNPEEQTAIAAYLDRKTAEIDELIADKKRLLELYEEEKTALINQAVTKGIHRDVPMKDSGIEWLGEIPEHWEVKRFDNLFAFSRGLPITKADLQESGIPCVSYGEIHSKYGFEVDPKRHLLKCVDEEYLKTNYKSLLQSGDFVFADTSEDLEGSGNFTYLNSSVPTFAGYHTIIGKPIIEFERRYLAYYFNTLSFRNQIRSKVTGTKVFSITQAILKFTNIIFPPIYEQQAIVNFIDKECTRINAKKAKTEKLIELLTEYRTALISEVVTGKIKVID